jgi:Domain of unknown function (DUF4340)
MALSTDKKLYVAVGVLVVLGGAFYLQHKKQAQEAESYTLEGQEKNLPKLDITEADVNKIDKIDISQPAGDAGKAVDVELVKKGKTWSLAKPLQASANQTNVKSLLDNLKTLKVSEQIDPSKQSYDRYGLTDAKATHAVFYEGGKALADLYLGDNGSRGQMTRIAGRDGVYAIQDFSSYMYKRKVKDWRDQTIFKFDDSDVKEVAIENDNGKFDFVKAGDSWTGKFAKGQSDALAKMDDLDPQKVKNMLNAYKDLNAEDFGDGKKPADVGLDKPTATVTLTMKDGGKKVLEVGGKSTGSNRWAQTNQSPQIYSISSWTAEWATAEDSKFEKTKSEKAKKKTAAKKGASKGK